VDEGTRRKPSDILRQHARRIAVPNAVNARAGNAPLNSGRNARVEAADSRSTPTKPGRVHT
jgi:hypothetical protein